MQVTDTIVMVRPASFEFNKETAADNFFQEEPSLPAQELHAKALIEFDLMVTTLREKGIKVIVAEDNAIPPKPDAIFPNNWFSTTADGRLFRFPMYTANRRIEKQLEIEKIIGEDHIISSVKDYSYLEAEQQFLEGTGSMVMDHENRIIYACVSERTSLPALEKFAGEISYRAMPFTAATEKGPIYHTNVMMSIGETFAVLCPKVITDHMERIAVAQLLEATGHENIYLEPEAMEKFACNLLQVKNAEGRSYIILSRTAYAAIPPEKIIMLEKHGELFFIDVGTIEKTNGGSVRCMMAEIFLPKKIMD